MILSVFAISLFPMVGSVSAQQAEGTLPGFGEGYATSLGQEYFLGRVWLMSFRRQAPIISDPLMQEYVEDLLYNLVATSELKDRRLELVLVNHPSINAFAVPGGVVGVHNGLLDKATTEAQFASVLTHELAHVSQRHFARSREAAKNTSVIQLAGLLTGALLAVTDGGSSAVAAVMGTQAAAMQSKLRFSRLHEQEADRIGMKNMVRANMNPMGAEEMFKIMQTVSRSYGGRPPEFLMTHPLTETRISDARNRSREYPRKIYTENLEYQLMRARVALRFAGESDKAVAMFREKLAKSGINAEPNQYGLVLALTENGDYAEAKKLLSPLLEYSPSSMIYGIAEAEIYIAEGNQEKALELLQRGLTLVPDNHPITMTLAEAHVKFGDHHKAAALLEKHAKTRAKDPAVWYQLAESQGQSGNTLGVHQARAEYFALTGQPIRAKKQLGFAMQLPNLDELTRTRLRERIMQIEQLEIAMRNF
ncbi:MAG: M48 family metalloprotease [Oceanicoccus sp.]